MASKMKTDFVMNFAGMLGEYGDMFFSCGDVEQDYDLIVGTVEQQGYWSGNSLRYYFDPNYKLLRMEERRF